MRSLFSIAKALVISITNPYSHRLSLCVLTSIFFLPAFEAQATVECLYGLYVLQSGRTKLIPDLIIHETTGYDE